jgi:cell shape-determining protein MreC
MKYIANVVSKSKKYKFNEFINVTSSYEDVDISVPTLIVGTEIVKSIFGDNISYIDRKIDENTFWTYSVTEKRSSNEDDIEKFKDFVLKSLKKNICYNYINLLTIENTSLEEILNSLEKKTDISYLFTDKMLYFSYDDVVKGISLDSCEYIGWKKEEVIKKIISFTKNVTSIHRLPNEIDKNFFKNDDILLAAMFCYLNR